MKSIERRVLALEQRVIHVKPVEILPLVEVARRAAFVMRLGANAREELDADTGSLDPERRAALTEVLDAAKRIASLLARPVNGDQPNMKEELTSWQHQ